MIAPDLDGRLRLPFSAILPPGPREWALARLVLGPWWGAAQAEMLALLAGAGRAGMTTSELARRRGRVGGSAWHGLERLRRRGLVVRERYAVGRGWGWRWRLA